MSHIGMRLNIEIATAVEHARKRLDALRIGQNIPLAMASAIQAEEIEFRQASETLDLWLHASRDEETSDANLVQRFNNVAPIRPKARPLMMQSGPPEMTDEECALAVGVQTKPATKASGTNPFEADRIARGETKNT